MFWSCNNHDCRIDAVFVLLIIYIFCSKSAITQENRRNWKHQDRRGMDSWAQRYEKRNFDSDKSHYPDIYIRCIDMFICTHIHTQTYGCKCANWGGGGGLLCMEVSEWPGRAAHLHPHRLSLRSADILYGAENKNVTNKRVTARIVH